MDKIGKQEKGAAYSHNSRYKIILNYPTTAPTVGSVPKKNPSPGVKPTSDSATPAAELRYVSWPSEFRHFHDFDSWPGSHGAIALASPCMDQGDLAIGVDEPQRNLVSGLPDTGKGTAPAGLGWRTAPAALGNRIAPADLG